MSSRAAFSQPESRCDWPPSDASHVASCTSAGSRPASAASGTPADACAWPPRRTRVFWRRVFGAWPATGENACVAAAARM